MEYSGKSQISDSLSLAVVLNLAGGFQDAYSYNCRDHVFANAQTGNVVLLGQNLADGNWNTAIHYLAPILAFAAGVYVTELIRSYFRESRRLHWRQMILLGEIVLLLLAGLMPQNLNMAANMLLSFSCAMQVNGFRKFRGMPSATTMCIGNMRSATELLCRYHITKDRQLKTASLQYYFIILVFASGAGAGFLLCRLLGNHAIWASACLLAVGFIMMFQKEKTQPL